MARQLTSVPDIDAPNGEYPAGRIKNEIGEDSGTPVVEELYGDIIQFFHKLMRSAGLTYNDLPDNETTGHQFLQALATYARSLASTTTIKGSVELATDAETQAGLDTQRCVTPAGLSSRTASINRTGLVALATTEAVNQGEDNNLAITPSLLAEYLASKFATDQETQTGTSNGKIVTPHGLNSRVASTGGVRGLISIATLDDLKYGENNSIAVPPGALYDFLAYILGTFVRTMVINIGAWDMDNIQDTQVSHALTLSKIIEVSAIIISDDSTIRGSFLGAGSILTLSNHFELYRNSGGLFDSSSYSNNVMNRGIIVVKYIQ